MKYFLPLLFLFSLRVDAMPLDPIAVNGKLWLQPLDFVGLSWSEISGVCDPNCNGELAGIDLAGWQWASTAEVNSLFNFYIGTPELGSGPGRYLIEDELDLAYAFLAAGWEPTAPLDIISLSLSAVGLLSDTADRVGVVGGGLSRTGLISVVGTDIDASGFTAAQTGAWLSRVDVPAPAPFLLIVPVLLFLLARKTS